MLRQLAAQFAGETGVPLNSLGVVQDNPSSADAIYAAKEDIIVDALAQNRVLGSATTRAAVRTVMLRDGLTEPTPELRKLRTRWANPAFPSPVSDTEITRLASDRKRAASGALIDALSRVGNVTPIGQVQQPAAVAPVVAGADNRV
jgi:hypothetical protein